jgi:hypothetical protein
MEEELKWVPIGILGGDFHDLRDAENRIWGWVCLRNLGITYWLVVKRMNPSECPCTTLEEAKRFVEAQYRLTRGG